VSSSFIYLFPFWAGFVFSWQIRINISVDKALKDKSTESRGALFLAKMGTYVIHLAGLFGFMLIGGKNAGDIKYSVFIILGVLAYWIISRPIVRTIFRDDEFED
jgi:hypothetical protein